MTDDMMNLRTLLEKSSQLALELSLHICAYRTLDMAHGVSRSGRSTAASPIAHATRPVTGYLTAPPVMPAMKRSRNRL